MHINSVDNTNFRMAMKINPKLESEIAKKGQNFVTELEKYGESLSGVKNYDVIFYDSFTPQIKRADNTNNIDYFGKLKQEESILGKYYERNCGMVGETVGGFYPNEPSLFIRMYGKDAKKRYAEFKKLDIMAQAAEYSKMLEECDIEAVLKSKKDEAERLAKVVKEEQEQETLKKSVENLINRFRYNPEENIKKTEEKSPWKRIFGFGL